MVTPFERGFRLAAEFETHETTWLAWPHNPETWPGRLAEVEEIYQQMIEALAPGERISLLVNDDRMRCRVSKRLSRKGIPSGKITYLMISTADAWIRDYGPSFISKAKGNLSRKALVCWDFNAWGGKYPSHLRDRSIPDQLGAFLKISVYRPGWVLEGGSIDGNGKGTVLTTEQCLLNPNRNPGSSREKIEKALHDFLGVTQVIWLGRGIEGDDTDGHVDNLSRFVAPGTVVTAVEADPADPNEVPLRENLRRLQRSVDQDGKKFEIVALPLPGRISGPSRRLPASYLNFYIGNEVVLVPVFGQPNDARALRILHDLFPKKKVIGIRSESLLLGWGGIHCITHEEPK